MKLLATLLAAVLVCLPAAVRAQVATLDGSLTGARVRILVPAMAPEPFVGRLIAFAGDSVVLGATSRLATARLPLAELQRVDASDGRDRVGAALRYGAVGLVAGSVLGVVVLRTEGENNPLLGIAGAFAGAVLGAPIGAATGALLAPERWRTVWTSATGAR